MNKGLAVKICDAPRQFRDIEYVILCLTIKAVLTFAGSEQTFTITSRLQIIEVTAWRSRSVPLLKTCFMELESFNSIL